MTHHTAQHRDPAMNSCIENCSSCHAICLETVNYCLGQGGKHAEAGHIGLMLSCADICATCTDTMLCGSKMHKVTCGACAAICDACAASCESIADDTDMQRCAEACRRCAEDCRRMAA